MNRVRPAQHPVITGPLGFRIPPGVFRTRVVTKKGPTSTSGVETSSTSTLSPPVNINRTIAIPHGIASDDFQYAPIVTASDALTWHHAAQLDYSGWDMGASIWEWDKDLHLIELVSKSLAGDSTSSLSSSFDITRAKVVVLTAGGINSVDLYADLTATSTLSWYTNGTILARALIYQEQS